MTTNYAGARFILIIIVITRRNIMRRNIMRRIIMKMNIIFNDDISNDLEAV